MTSGWSRRFTRSGDQKSTKRWQRSQMFPGEACLPTSALSRQNVVNPEQRRSRTGTRLKGNVSSVLTYGAVPVRRPCHSHGQRGHQPL
jgi:hypothetical protein